jgi:hypothetical protein
MILVVADMVIVAEARERVRMGRRRRMVRRREEKEEDGRVWRSIGSE